MSLKQQQICKSKRRCGDNKNQGGWCHYSAKHIRWCPCSLVQISRDIDGVGDGWACMCVSPQSMWFNECNTQKLVLIKQKTGFTDVNIWRAALSRPAPSQDLMIHHRVLIYACFCHLLVMGWEATHKGTYEIGRIIQTRLRLLLMTPAVDRHEGGLLRKFSLHTP